MNINKETKTIKKTDKWFDEYFNQMKLQASKMKKIMSSTDYIEWLDRFTQNIGGFSDDNWLYCPEKIDDEDRKKVENLGLFYEGIREYAKRQFINPTPCKHGDYFKIRLNDVGFEISMLGDQRNIVYFCKRVSITDEEEFIDFNDILINKNQDQTDQIKESLISLSNMIKDVYKSGVPIDSITDTFENTIEEINSNNKDKRLIK